MHLKIDKFFTNRTAYLALKIDEGKPSYFFHFKSLSFRIRVKWKSIKIERNLISKSTQNQRHVVRQWHSRNRRGDQDPSNVCETWGVGHSLGNLGRAFWTPSTINLELHLRVSSLGRTSSSCLLEQLLCRQKTLEVQHLWHQHESQRWFEWKGSLWRKNSDWYCWGLRANGNSWTSFKLAENHTKRCTYAANTVDILQASNNGRRLQSLFAHTNSCIIWNYFYPT